MNSVRPPPDLLARIVDAERGVVEKARSARPIAALERAPRYAAPRRSLVASLRTRRPAVIAECKRSSPSRGILRDPYDPVAIARSYESAGAAGLSVLTNEEFFGGSLGDLSAVRDATAIPLLRKDFVIDVYQIVEARAAGADAILLIAAVLSPSEMRELASVARGLGLETLVEVHDEQELEAALTVEADLLGINNRDLRRFITDLGITERLRPRIPPDRMVVAESGIRDRADLERLGRAKVSAFLIGEAFMVAPDPGQALRGLLEPVPEGAMG